MGTVEVLESAMVKSLCCYKSLRICLIYRSFKAVRHRVREGFPIVIIVSILMKDTDLMEVSELRGQDYEIKQLSWNTIAQKAIVDYEQLMHHYPGQHNANWGSNGNEGSGISGGFESK